MEIAGILDGAYGRRTWSSHGSPLEELVATVLSQHTSDLNTARSYASLRRAFPTWEEVVSAPTHLVADAIRCGGLANIKAPRIQQILRDIRDKTGLYDLACLVEMPMDEARSWLMNLRGVGPKTAACVLLFSLGLPAMPVDTHVFRVGQRLGLIDKDVPPESAHAFFEAGLAHDRDAIYSSHLNLIAHGRSICRARSPRCGECVLARLCPSAAISGDRTTL
ncbi:MAG: endonuclease III [Thermomicrobiales bacterium]